MRGRVQKLQTFTSRLNSVGSALKQKTCYSSAMCAASCSQVRVLVGGTVVYLDAEHQRIGIGQAVGEIKAKFGVRAQLCELGRCV